MNDGWLSNFRVFFCVDGRAARVGLSHTLSLASLSGAAKSSPIAFSRRVLVGGWGKDGSLSKLTRLCTDLFLPCVGSGAECCDARFLGGHGC